MSLWSINPQKDKHNNKKYAFFKIDSSDEEQQTTTQNHSKFYKFTTSTSVISQSKFPPDQQTFYPQYHSHYQTQFKMPVQNQNHCQVSSQNQNSILKTADSTGFNQYKLFKKLQSNEQMSPDFIQQTLSKQQFKYVQTRIFKLTQIQPQNIAFLNTIYPSNFTLIRKYRPIQNFLIDNQKKPHQIKQVTIKKETIQYQLDLNSLKQFKIPEFTKFCKLQWINLIFLSINNSNLQDEAWNTFSANIIKFSQLQTLLLNENKIKQVRQWQLNQFPYSIKKISLCTLFMTIVKNRLSILSLQNIQQVVKNRKIQILINQQEKPQKNQKGQHYSDFLTSDISYLDFIEVNGSRYEDQMILNELRDESEDTQNRENAKKRNQFNQFKQANVSEKQIMDFIIKICGQIFQIQLKSGRQLSDVTFMKNLDIGKGESQQQKKHKGDKQKKMFQVLKKRVWQFGKLASSGLICLMKSFISMIETKYKIKIKEDVEGFLKNELDKMLSLDLIEKIQVKMEGKIEKGEETEKSEFYEVNEGDEFREVSESQGSILNKGIKVEEKQMEIREYFQEKILVFLATILTEGYNLL